MSRRTDEADFHREREQARRLDRLKAIRDKETRDRAVVPVQPNDAEIDLDALAELP